MAWARPGAIWGRSSVRAPPAFGCVAPGVPGVAARRMALTDLGDRGLEALLQHVAERRRRQDRAERRAVERALGREHRPDRDQQRAAALHVFGDVAEVVARDQVPRLVAV